MRSVLCFRREFTVTDIQTTASVRPTPNRAARRHPDAPPVVPLFVSLAEAGIRCGLCERTIRRAISAGELPGFKFGKAVRVRLDDLDKWAESKAIPNARTVAKRGGAA